LQFENAQLLSNVSARYRIRGPNTKSQLQSSITSYIEYVTNQIYQQCHCDHMSVTCVNCG